jgi:hypothetical protein
MTNETGLATQVDPEITDSPRLLRGVPTAIAIAVVRLGIVDVVDTLAPERAARLARPHQGGAARCPR